MLHVPSLRRRGFTLVEVLVSIGIATVLLSVVTINLSSASRKASLSGNLDMLVSDLQSQRRSAMLGRDGQSGYGIFLNQTNYVLFDGLVYDENAPSNFTVQLDPNVELANITLPNTQIVFLAGSGEVNGFVNGSNTFLMVDTTGGSAKTFTINKLGTIVSLQ